MMIRQTKSNVPHTLKTVQAIWADMSTEASINPPTDVATVLLVDAFIPSSVTTKLSFPATVVMLGPLVLVVGTSSCLSLSGSSVTRAAVKQIKGIFVNYK